MRIVILIMLMMLLSSCRTTSDTPLDLRVHQVHQKVLAKGYVLHKYDCSNRSAEMLTLLHKMGIKAEIHCVRSRFFGHAWIYIYKTGHIVDSTSMNVYPAKIDVLTGKDIFPPAMCRIAYEDLQILQDPSRCSTWEPREKVPSNWLKVIRDYKEWKY